MAKQVIFLPDAAATQALGQQWGRSLPSGTVLLLSGDLGSGKTSLVQGIGAGLGIADVILSPTFTLVSEYFDGRLPLYHIDLYRLSPAEVASLNLETYWEGGEMPLGVVAIEWAERLTPPPADYLAVQLAIAPQAGRYLTLTPHGRASLPDLTPFPPLSPSALPE